MEGDRQLNRWIDIHNHLLPAVDDGSVSMQQTKNMLQIAYEDGIRYIIATPHYGAGCRNTDIAELEGKLELVRQEAKQIDEAFRIELGNELYYSEDIIEHLRKKKALTLAGTRYVLVEFAADDDYREIKTGLHRLLIHGYLPILSHAEKYECLYRNYEGIRDLIWLGAYMQMNISSITGGYTGRWLVHCKKLLEYDLIHILGTDAHSDYGREPRISGGLEFIRKKFGELMIKQLMVENTLKLLQNERI